MPDREEPSFIEMLCRALAAHAMITVHAAELGKFTAPETAETVAEIILRFARGEQMARPKMKTEEESIY